MTTNFLNVSVKMWSVLCFYMIHKTLSLSPTRYKRGHWQTIVKRWRKQGKHSQFDLLFCGYILLYYWKLHFLKYRFMGKSVWDKMLMNSFWNAPISTSDLFHFWWVSWHIWCYLTAQHPGSISSSVSSVVSTRETWSSKSFECVSNTAA